MSEPLIKVNEHHTVGLRVSVPSGQRSNPGPRVMGTIVGKNNSEFYVRFDEEQPGIGMMGFFTFNEIQVIA